MNSMFAAGDLLLIVSLSVEGLGTACLQVILSIFIVFGGVRISISAGNHLHI